MKSGGFLRYKLCGWTDKSEFPGIRLDISIKLLKTTRILNNR